MGERDVRMEEGGCNEVKKSGVEFRIEIFCSFTRVDVAGLYNLIITHSFQTCVYHIRALEVFRVIIFNYRVRQLQFSRTSRVRSAVNVNLTVSQLIRRDAKDVLLLCFTVMPVLAFPLIIIVTWIAQLMH